MVVNYAGYAAGGSVEDFPEDEFRAQIEANLFGVVNVTRAALPVLRRRRSGHIVQISSIGGRVGGTPGLSAYQSAKFAVEGFSEALASEVAPLGIKVTIVEPGGIRTGWAAGAATPVGRIGADYEQTVGQWLERFEAYSGNGPGDPARMAKALVDVVYAPAPPRRLLLGSDALDIALGAEEGRLTEARWSSSPERVLRVARRLRTGTVTLNGSPISFDGPFGVYKASGFGREYGPVGLNGHLEHKTITRHRSPPRAGAVRHADPCRGGRSRRGPRRPGRRSATAGVRSPIDRLPCRVAMGLPLNAQGSAETGRGPVADSPAVTSRVRSRLLHRRGRRGRPPPRLGWRR